MPGLSGFEVARRLVDRGTDLAVVFVTAFDHRAVEAFEVNAVCSTGRRRLGAWSLRRTVARCRQAAARLDNRGAGALAEPMRRTLTGMSSGGAWQRRIAGVLFATSVAKRALASIRWRAGLDAELNDLRWQVATLERTIESVVAQVSAPLPTRGSIKAFATPADAELLETLLLRTSARFHNTLRVLEWGSGLSTLHYPGWLRSRGVRVALDCARARPRPVQAGPRGCPPRARRRGRLGRGRYVERVRRATQSGAGDRLRRRIDRPRTRARLGRRSQQVDGRLRWMPATLGFATTQSSSTDESGDVSRRSCELLEDGGIVSCMTPNESTTAPECRTSDRADASETSCGSVRRSTPTSATRSRRCVRAWA